MAPREWTLHEHDGAAYEWCLNLSGWVKLRKVGAGKEFVKQWKPRKRPGP